MSRIISMRKIRLMFESFEHDGYIAPKVVDIRADCPLKDVVETALKVAYDNLFDFRGHKEITLEKGWNTSMHVDWEDEGVDFLRKILMKAEILEAETDYYEKIHYYEKVKMKKKKEVN